MFRPIVGKLCSKGGHRRRQKRGMKLSESQAYGGGASRLGLLGCLVRHIGPLSFRSIMTSCLWDRSNPALQAQALKIVIDGTYKVQRE